MNGGALMRRWPAVWPSEREAIAMHEAAHAHVSVRLFGYRDPGFVVTIDPASDLLPEGAAGVSSAIGADQTGRRKFLRHDRYEQRLRVAKCEAILNYAGIAAQFPHACAMSLHTGDIAYYSSCDRRDFVEAARRLGFWAGTWDFRSWLLACRWVDFHLGEVRAIAEALLEHNTLRGPEVERLIRTAEPEMNLERDRWSPDDPWSAPRVMFDYEGEDFPSWWDQIEDEPAARESGSVPADDESSGAAPGARVDGPRANPGESHLLAAAPDNPSSSWVLLAPLGSGSHGSRASSREKPSQGQQS